MSSVNSYLPIVSIVITIFGLLYQHLKGIVELRGRVKNLEESTGALPDLIARVGTLGTKMELFWGLVERELPRLLKQPHAEEKDELLEKMSRGEITKDEAQRLKDIVKRELEELEDKSVAVAYILVIARLEQIGL